MSTYLAVVKYAVDAEDAEKIRALKDGLEDCAARLVELGLTAERVAELCEQAADFAAEVEREKHDREAADE